MNINRNINNNNNFNSNNFNNNRINKESNSINNNNIYIQDSTNDNNNYLKNNQIFTSFAPEIRTNTASNYENKNNNINNKIYYNTDKRIYGAGSGYEQSYPEEKKVYNVFNYNKENENGINDINNNMNKYADIDKLIENSEKNFFKTQKLLEDYEKK